MASKYVVVELARRMAPLTLHAYRLSVGGENINMSAIKTLKNHLLGAPSPGIKTLQIIE
jgi:hypothetical protein